MDVNTGPCPADITAISDYLLSGGPDYEAVPTRTPIFEPSEMEEIAKLQLLCHPQRYVIQTTRCCLCFTQSIIDVCEGKRSGTKQ